MIGGDRVLDEYFKREDVLSFIQELESNPKYLRKIVHEESKYGMQMKEELALYLFYDIIFKYKVIIDDPYLFPDFLMQVEKLFRKIEHYDDMMVGVYKLLIRLVATVTDVKDIDSSEGRNEIIRYFYQKYVLEGYFIHGYSTTYEEFIKGRNFVPEQYPNHYSRMLRIKQIFVKYKIPVMNKDFQKNAVDFTDDFVMACHYSVASPGYIYQFIGACCKDQRDYLKQDCSTIMSSLKRFMINNSFSLSDQKTVLNIFEEEWNFIYRVPRRVSLLFVKKNKIMQMSNDKLNEYLDSHKSLLSIVERILMPKYNCISVENTIRYGEYQIISLDKFYKCFIPDDAVELSSDKSFTPLKLLNSSGVISFLLILGSFCITLGVIVTIIMILRGM